MDAVEMLAYPSASSRKKRNTLLPKSRTTTPPQETTRSPEDYQSPPCKLTDRLLAKLKAIQHSPSYAVAGQQEKNLPLRDPKLIMIVIKYATNE